MGLASRSVVGSMGSQEPFTARFIKPDLMKQKKSGVWPFAFTAATSTPCASKSSSNAAESIVDTE